MITQLRKRETLVDLICAKIAPKDIYDAVGVSLKTMYIIQKAMAGRDGTKRKSGNSGKNKKRTPEFLDALQTKINEDPTKFLRKLAKT